MELNIKPLRLPVKNKVASTRDFFPATENFYSAFGEVANEFGDFNFNRSVSADLLAHNSLSIFGGERLIGTDDEPAIRTTFAKSIN